MSIEVMKQALEALESVYGRGKRCDAAIATLRRAIEQAEQQEPAPPQRQWVGLTPEEAKEISLANRPYVIDMVRALEQRLKEKNGG